MCDYQYQVGGSLGSDAPSYVVRQADEDIYNALIAGEFCYVLNSRQTGKSSILVRTKHRLQQQGFQCAFLDMTRVGSKNITPQQWYYGIITELWRGLNLIGKVNLKSWFDKQEKISYVQQLSIFIEDVVLTEFQTEKILIFIDEIDSILSLNFDLTDFFALIRFCYNHRATNSKYNRINFAIFGVATPPDLIIDKKRTPFNIGTAIELQGFQLSEVAPLVKGLEGKIANPQKAIKEILAWTGGQPFLTQKLCQMLENGNQEVDAVVHKQIIQNWESQDEPEHLRTIHDRIEYNQQRMSRMLELYKQTLQNKKVKADDSREQVELILSGLVVKNQGFLKVKNRIYQNVFNLEWVSKKLDSLRPYSQTFNAWLASNQQDISRLLRGQALVDAQLWAHGKSLSNLDYQYLTASIEFDRQQESLILQAQRGQEIEKRFAIEKKFAFLQRLLLIAVSFALIVSTSLGVTTWLQYRQAVNNEIKALATSADALFASNKQLDALVGAIKAKRKLQEQGQVIQGLDLEVNSVLERTVFGAVEHNRLTGHHSGVLGVDISPDGQTIATSSPDRTIKLWKRDGTLLKTLTGNKAAVFKVKFSPDGKIIGSICIDGAIKLWKLDGTLLKKIKGHEGAVWDVAFNANGNMIVSGGADGSIKVWKLDNNIYSKNPVYPSLTIKGHNAGVWGVAFSPDDSIIASASDDSTIKLFQTDGTHLKTFTGHKSSVWDIAFSRDGRTIISSSEDKTIKLWQLDGTVRKTITGHGAGVMAIYISKDGKIIASASADKTVKLWTREGNLLDTLKKHDAGVWDVAMSDDNKLIASASLDSTVKLWQPQSKFLKTFNIHDGTVWGVAYSPDGKTIASASGDKTVKLWKQDNNITTLKASNAAIIGIAFSPDGNTLASADADKTINLWQLQNIDTNSTSIPALTLTGHNSEVRSISFSPDGEMLASGSGDKTVKLWKRNGTLLKTLKGHNARIMTVVFSPNGNLIASSSADGTVKIWKPDGSLLSTLTGHTAAVWGVDFSPDGNTIASASVDGSIKLWRTDGSLIKNITINQPAYSRIDFSPNGQLLAVGTWQNTVQLWKLDGTLVQTLTGGHDSTVWSVAFSPDGNHLVSGSDDQRVIVWDIKQILNLNFLDRACDWVGDYLRTNAEVKQEDRRLCDGIDKRAF
ncbi:WD-40 repeat protein [Calothrix sp. NIES-4071]|nr:WD-40 repeat protein [Calothrix sp. NIES-4071]BAZ56136.1 WD-40 repeat protein [Calothrix sp. NIES-4105]